MLQPDAGSPGWVVQPLVDAGLERAEIESMLFSVAFAARVGDGTLDASLRTVAADRQAGVQAAWLETIDRMMTADL